MPCLTRRAVLLGGLASAGCVRRAARDAGTVVFKHQPLWGDPAPFRALLAEFERAHDVRVVTEALPNASDVLHQFYMTALGGGADDFDVLVVDVAWVAELARAGWLADLSQTISPDHLRGRMIAAAVDAAIFDRRTFAVPWYVDVGLLYRRADLVEEAPRTFDDLTTSIDRARSREPALHGLLFQGRQSEGLVCNAYEAIWGHGGAALRDDGGLAIATDEAMRGVSFLRTCIASGRSPRNVLSAAEEETRRAFQAGRAVFMRNWPYARAELERDASPVRGRVEVSALPTVSGEPGSGTLGGWCLALNAHARGDHRALGAELVRHLTSSAASVTMAVAYARSPPTLPAHTDPRLVARAPHVHEVLAFAARAKARPVTPYYGMLSEILQSELSAAVSGVRAVPEALARAQKLADRVMGRL